MFDNEIIETIVENTNKRLDVIIEKYKNIIENDKNNNYLLTVNKVTLFSREKPEIFYWSSDSETNNSSRVLRGKKCHFLPVNT